MPRSCVIECGASFAVARRAETVAPAGAQGVGSHTHLHQPRPATRSSPCPRSLVSARCEHAAVLARCSVSTLWCCVCAVSVRQCVGEAWARDRVGIESRSDPVVALVLRSAQRYPQRSSALRAFLSLCDCVEQRDLRDSLSSQRLDCLLSTEIPPPF
jgi:hypothetical protein